MQHVKRLCVVHFIDQIVINM